MTSGRRIVVTGAAGFIGFHLSQFLLTRGDDVIGIDNLNSYYDVGLKQARLERLKRHAAFSFHLANICEQENIEGVISQYEGVSHIVHLAAQAGVRASLTRPVDYADTNIRGQIVMLECARKLPQLGHFVYASSSSVYGLNESFPYRETDAVDQPSSVYGVTKRAGELLSSTYAHLYGFPQTGLRFFTVYGPWGRPDMAYYKFAEAIEAGESITLYDAPDLARDFTYIDDIVSGVVAALDKPGPRGSARIFNLGGDQPVKVREMVRMLSEGLGREAQIDMQPLPKTDILCTWACLARTRAELGWAPRWTMDAGMTAFIDWFRDYRSAQS